MTTRRDFLSAASAMAAGVTLGPRLWATTATFPSHRPPLDQRRFTSDAVEGFIQEVKSACHPELAWMFDGSDRRGTFLSA